MFSLFFADDAERIRQSSICAISQIGHSLSKLQQVSDVEHGEAKLPPGAVRFGVISGGIFRGGGIKTEEEIHALLDSFLDQRRSFQQLNLQTGR